MNNNEVHSSKLCYKDYLAACKDLSNSYKQSRGITYIKEDDYLESNKLNQNDKTKMAPSNDTYNMSLELIQLDRSYKQTKLAQTKMAQSNGAYNTMQYQNHRMIQYKNLPYISRDNNSELTKLYEIYDNAKLAQYNNTDNLIKCRNLPYIPQNNSVFTYNNTNARSNQRNQIQTGQNITIFR